jgi:hypothetical protein
MVMFCFIALFLRQSFVDDHFVLFKAGKGPNKTKIKESNVLF